MKKQFVIIMVAAAVTGIGGAQLAHANAVELPVDGYTCALDGPNFGLCEEKPRWACEYGQSTQDGCDTGDLPNGTPIDCCASHPITGEG